MTNRSIPGTRKARTSMPTAEARIQTERPGRYLAQLCRHASQTGKHTRHRPRPLDGGDQAPEVQHVEWTDTYGVVSMSWGQWTMQASPDTLTVRAQAADEEKLRRIQDLIEGRLGRFGRRDHLTVNGGRPGPPTARKQPSTRRPDPACC